MCVRLCALVIVCDSRQITFCRGINELVKLKKPQFESNKGKRVGVCVCVCVSVWAGEIVWERDEKEGDGVVDLIVFQSESSLFTGLDFLSAF